LSQFEITIAHQGWLAGVTPEEDLCSHGGIRLRISGIAITTGAEDYGISESALALLRTLASDRVRGDALAEVMIFHGCGAMLMGGCSLGVDWTTRHVAERVLISDVVRYDGAGGTDAHFFPDAIADLPFGEYASAVIPFARAARALFEGVSKTVKESEFAPGAYSAFWREYDDLLVRYGHGTLIPLAV